MLGGLLFSFWRIAEIVTLIPVIGMLAWFVDGFNKNNQLTPSFILVLFIVSILACAWALATLIRLGSTRRSALFVAFVDLCFVGAFIAADYYLRGIGDANCASFDTGSIYVDLGPFGYYGRNSGSSWAIHLNKNCAMLKASWALGIINTVFFFFTFILALFLHRHERGVVVKEFAPYTSCPTKACTLAASACLHLPSSIQEINGRRNHTALEKSMSMDLGELATLMGTSDAIAPNPRSSTTPTIDPDTGYFVNIDEIREAEYPALAETTYLDHAGTTLYAKSLIESYAKDLTSNLFGNPHSASASSQLSSRRIDDVRLQALRFFNANPDEFDLVFVANATAAIKLVGEALRDREHGFKYHYHGEAHTSLVGLRELAALGSDCLATDEQVEEWLSSVERGLRAEHGDMSLFAYPAQSNMTGRRLPLQWCRRLNSAKTSSGNRVLTLLDAASLVSTAPLDLSDSFAAPDFVALSFYKIFGFPDVGALLVRKSSGEILRQRKYFGGGTVDMVTMFGDTWHAKKESSLHSCLEDGTLPFHNIIALQLAFDVHKRLYGTMSNISRHSTFLASVLRGRLQTLRHGNGSQVCAIYTGDFSANNLQGPVIAFNLRDTKGKYISNLEVEKLATVKNVQFRTGNLCNPGGVAYHLELSPDEMRRNYAVGQRCGGDNDMIGDKPTGAIRVSLGPMSNMSDVETMINFVQEFFVDPSKPPRTTMAPPDRVSNLASGSFVVESLSVFPIKSCAAYKIPADVPWEVGVKGLVWDREWCLVHEGTNVALSQKRFPQMALIRPEIDLQNRMLRLSFSGSASSTLQQLAVSLDSGPMPKTCEATTNKWSNVCGDDVDVQVYTSDEVSGFFTAALGVPCTLARFPCNGNVRQAKVRVPGSGPGRGKQATALGKSIALSNESPILLISRSSVNRLNEQIKHNAGIGKAVAADSFRANIVIAEELDGGQTETPYIEEGWTGLQIGDDPAHSFDLLGLCQRCQMVCVDQTNAQRRQEPFSTLAKTRRKDGRVWFGMHMCLSSHADTDTGPARPSVRIQAGDRVTATGHI